MIRVLVVDDQTIMREGLVTILQLENNLEVVGTATNGLEAFELAEQHRPDVVVMDIYMPKVDGVEGTRLIKQKYPAIKVLILTTFNDNALLLRAMDEGASGYLLKEMPAESIISAIMTVATGGVVLQPVISQQLVHELKKAKSTTNQHEAELLRYKKLTDREQEVLKLLGMGCNNREIADKLFISEGTAKLHVSNIISKMDFRDRTQAAIFAVRYGITEFT
ncbi:Transcriptional regulatory protein LnrK [Paenibacillus plantiphilus]|uniref:Transcriptional regulatory protein LnrK n=1 Tax=Paenibacillus plantiphilus TaxID=2905650 RepID=A0ABM9C532_9BACL|nr:response regulator transcription factor [Paenibacillus plantiphilus]CAH1202732.1 Transcriptional regulatory protein LnrK [Paenibacillus plantiphilus]